jgi:hypothetical protein
MVVALVAVGCQGDVIVSNQGTNTNQVFDPPCVAPCDRDDATSPIGDTDRALTCTRSSCTSSGNCSGFTCAWGDDQIRDLCFESTDGVYPRRCEQRTSGGSIDPSSQDTQARIWEITLEDGGAILAGPVYVQTDS